MKANAGENGFTLLEVLISFSILAALFGISFSLLNGLVRTTTTIDGQRDMRLIAGNVLTRLTRELQMISTSGRGLLPPEELCGTSQSQTNNNSFAASLNQTRDGRAASVIEFVARQAGQHFLEGGGAAGAVHIRYFLAQDPESDRTLLIREERPNIRPCEKANERSLRFAITDKVRSMRFEFLDSEELVWREQWDEVEERRLPNIIRFEFELEDLSGKVHNFASAVALRGNR